MAGKLYVVGTPIGNLGDMSPRALEILRQVDFVAAEDTRVSGKLLNLFEIKKPLVSYYQHNMRERGEMLLERILAGEDCAVVTDAGMPCISDPGEDLVRLCAENGVEVVTVPGPSAAISALAVSGLPTARFSFEGFLSTNRRGRMEHLQEVKNDRHTLIFYEAPHKLVGTLEDMLETLGDRRVSLCRELTKLHEEVIRTTFSGALERYRETAPRGEYVLIVEGAPEPQKGEGVTLEEAVEQVKALQAAGESISAAAKAVAQQTGFKKGELYRLALQ
ncbi:MAG: 16S rRNA (cytidine(1402)-2'-O)-methyltransferase [Oscillospiraceae bacterium]|nr:16S rRNA (cytidine(1402)-2'-O)-methyltransferase [Oscillospiraceae bacterium]